MPALLNLTGRKIGRLAVTRWTFKANNIRHWVCDCECGHTVAVRHELLRRECHNSCGCLVKEASTRNGLLGTAVTKKHGMWNTPEYRRWSKMKCRCLPNSANAKDYYDRGIRVCDEWLHDFDAFYKHVGPLPSKTHSLDRIDNDKGYQPGNVRWATRAEQARNKRNNVKLEFAGQVKCLQDWCVLFGLPVECARQKQKRHKWTVQQMLDHYGVDYSTYLREVASVSDQSSG